jgi:hypothetical protein
MSIDKEMSINVIYCMLTDVVESGYSDYWAKIRDVQCNQKGYVTSFEVQDADEPASRWIGINEKTVRETVKKILNGDIKVGRDVAVCFRGKADDWDYDSISADCVIQAATFGKIVYG